MKDVSQEAVKEDCSDHMMKIAIIHPNVAQENQDPVYVSVIIEGTEVLEDCGSVTNACLLLMDVIYAVNLSYPLKLKYTLVFQKLFLELDILKMSAKVQSLHKQLKAPVLFVLLSSTNNLFTFCVSFLTVISSVAQFYIRSFCPEHPEKVRKDAHPDAFPNQMTPSDSTLGLVDAGHAINIGCVPVLRPERYVDIIITLNYSWDPEHIFNVMERTAAYCKDHGIPFPRADFASLEKEPKKEVYIFEDMKNPRAPIVVLFPLVNASFKHYKHPGVKRKSEKEVKAGEVDVSSSNSPYTTQNMTYSKEDYEALVELTAYNVANNKESILQALSKALDRKASNIKK